LLQHEDAENIGYVIPTPVMEHFINDYERNGQYTAFPALGIEWQKMESPFMRTALGMQVWLETQALGMQVWPHSKALGMQTW